MKAVLCKAFGSAESLVLEDVASPVAKKNEILLEVHAAGVNFPDTLIIEGKYQFKPPFPFSPGGEASGVVSAVGEKVSHLKVGDRVMALTGWGSFAEQVAVPGYNVLPIPPSMDFNTAAAFSMTYGTSMHALKQRANLQPARPCWCSAPPVASAWRQWKSAKPWVPGSSPPPAARKNSPWPRLPVLMN